MKHFRHLPTIELQTLAWVQQTRKREENAAVTLSQSGYQATLSYFHRTAFGQQAARGVLQLEDVHVPPEFRGRDWLPRFCQLCQIMSGDAFAVRASETPKFLVSMSRWGFERITPGVWAVFNEKPKTWPFQLDV